MFKNIIKLRNALTDCAEKNNLFVALAGGDVDPTLDSGSFQTNGCAVTYNKNDQTVTYQSDGNKTIPVSELEEHLDDPIDNSGYVLGDLFNNASNTGDQYTTLAAITAKYSYSSRMTLTDVNNIIDASTNVPSDNSEVDTLKQSLVSASDDDGYVSINSWISCVSSWFNSAKEAADLGYDRIDDRRPFVLQALYDIVVNVVGQVISLIISALAIAFNAIFLVVGAIFNAIWGLLTKATNGVTTLAICPNEFIFGPVHHLEISPSSIGQYPHDRSIYYKEGVSGGVFLWWNKDYTAYNVNSYNAIQCSASTAAEWIRSNTSRIYWDSYGIYWRPNEDYNILMPISEADLDAATYDSNKFFECLAVGAFMRQFMGIRGFAKMFIDWGLNHDQWFNDGYSADIVSYFGVPLGATPGSPSKLANYGALMIYNALHGNDPWSGITFNFIESKSHDYMNNQYNNGGNLNSIMGTSTISIGTLSQVKDLNFPHVTANPSDREEAFVEVPENIDDYTFCWLYNEADGVCQWGINNMISMDKVDSLPSVFRFKLEDITNEAMILATAVVAVTATVTAVVATKLAKVMRIKKIKKSLKRMTRLNAAKEAYEANPTKENLNTYAREVERYNRLGKMFGWGTYDAKNGWVDSANGGDSVPDTTPTINAINSKTQSSIDRLIKLTERTNRILASITGETV